MHRRIFCTFRARSLARPLCFVSCEKKCILTRAILVQFHSFKVLRYISDRSLMCHAYRLSLLSHHPSAFFPGVLDRRESVPWFYCNTLHQVLLLVTGPLHVYQISPRELDWVGLTPLGLLQIL